MHSMGFGRIVLYDDDSTDDMAGVVADLPYVTIANFDGTTPACRKYRDSKRDKRGDGWCQHWVQEQCMAHYAAISSWITTMDIDEYVYPCKPGTTLPQVLSQSASVDHYQMNCAKFGTNGHLTDPASGAVQGHVRRQPLTLMGDAGAEQAMQRCNTLTGGDPPGGDPPVCEGPGTWKHLTRGHAVVSQHFTHKIDLRFWSTSSGYIETYAHGICCNHYTYTSVAGMQKCAKQNNNDLYTRIIASPSAMAFYNMVEDRTLANRRYGWHK